MRNFYLLSGFVLMVATLYVTMSNFDTDCKIDMTYWFINTNLGLVILGSAILGALTASGVWGYFYQLTKSSQSKQVREVEKAKIREEEKDDRVAALENKIETLEQALKKALNG